MGGTSFASVASVKEEKVTVKKRRFRIIFVTSCSDIDAGSHLPTITPHTEHFLPNLWSIQPRGSILTAPVIEFNSFTDTGWPFLIAPARDSSLPANGPFSFGQKSKFGSDLRFPISSTTRHYTQVWVPRFCQTGEGGLFFSKGSYSATIGRRADPRRLFSLWSLRAY